MAPSQPLIQAVLLTGWRVVTVLAISYSLVAGRRPVPRGATSPSCPGAPGRQTVGSSHTAGTTPARQHCTALLHRLPVNKRFYPPPLAWEEPGSRKQVVLGSSPPTRSPGESMPAPSSSPPPAGSIPRGGPAPRPPLLRRSVTLGRGRPPHYATPRSIVWCPD